MYLFDELCKLYGEPLGECGSHQLLDHSIGFCLEVFGYWIILLSSEDLCDETVIYILTRLSADNKVLLERKECS